jgi:hypothetical protein
MARVTKASYDQQYSEAKIEINDVTRDDMRRILDFLDEIEGRKPEINPPMKFEQGSIPMPKDAAKKLTETSMEPFLKEKHTYEKSEEITSNKEKEVLELVRGGMGVIEAGHKVYGKFVPGSVVKKIREITGNLDVEKPRKLGRKPKTETSRENITAILRRSPEGMNTRELFKALHGRYCGGEEQKRFKETLEGMEEVECEKRPSRQGGTIWRLKNREMKGDHEDTPEGLPEVTKSNLNEPTDLVEVHAKENGHETIDTVDEIDIENSLEGQGRTILEICEEVFGPGEHRTGGKEYGKIHSMLHKMHEDGKVRIEKDYGDNNRPVNTYHKVRERELVGDKDRTLGGKRKEEMGKCLEQFVTFLRPYEGKRQGFTIEDLRMAVDSPEWAKEQLVSQLNQRDPEFMEMIEAEHCVKISTYRGDSGEKRFLVEAA